MDQLKGSPQVLMRRRRIAPVFISQRVSSLESSHQLLGQAGPGPLTSGRSSGFESGGGHMTGTWGPVGTKASVGTDLTPEKVFRKSQAVITV